MVQPSMLHQRVLLKKAHREMSDHIEELYQKIHADSASPFENERVKRLWKAVTYTSNKSFLQADVITYLSACFRHRAMGIFPIMTSL